MKVLRLFLCVSAFLIVFGIEAANAQAKEKSSLGQVLYVPIYSEIPYGDRGFTFGLTATLSIRNTDRKSSITVRSVRYFDSKGKLIRSYVDGPISLSPLAAQEHIVHESDRSGGISALFIVEWDSNGPVHPPIVEAVMISTQSTQGISFLSIARVIEERE